MTRSTALQALLLATSTLAPIAAAGQTAAQSGKAAAIRVLLDQAQYWRAQYQADKASDALRRALVLDPDNADVLAIQAQSEADDGQTEAARTALAKLKTIRPDDPRIPGVEQTLNTGPIDSATLALARDLARTGKPDAAIAAYRRAFKSDAPPPMFAAEFYETLGTSSEDWTVARAGLAAVLRANPDNLSAQLAYAELLTYHAQSRDEGIARLGELTKNPAIAERATKDLRQSLTWLAVSRSSLPQYDVYLASHPDDPEIAQLAESARSNTGELRSAGYGALQSNRLDEAETQFTAALQANAKDADSLIGLALVRLKQNRAAEGKDLIRQAVALDPAKAETFQALLDDQPGPPGEAAHHSRTIDYAAVAQRRVRAQYAKIAALTNAGAFAQAETLLIKIAGRQPNAATQLYRADIQARAGRLTEAEAGYRAVLAKHPRNVQALGGLAGVLARDGKQDEAEALFARAAALPGGEAVGPAHANALRLQAERMTDPVAQIGAYRAAVAADPSSPWLRLTLARALIDQHDAAAACAVMAPLANDPKPSIDQLQASIYFASQVHDDAQVTALLARLPPKARTSQLLALAAESRTRLELRDAGALGNADATRDRLLGLAAAPDPSGQRVAAYADALIRAGDKRAAREAVRIALASRPATAQQRVVYAGVLLGAGYVDDARRITQRVTPVDATLSARLAQVQDGAAVASSDTLNAAGNPAAAYDELAPRLAASPGNTDLNLALARLYTSNKQPAKAVQITQGLLQRNPDSLAVRSSAIYAKLAAGDTAQAHELAQATAAQFPDEPQAWLDLANVERARGHSGQALRDLQTARALRQKQLAPPGDSAASTARDNRPPGAAAAAPVRRQYAQYAAYIPANTASDAAPEIAPEPVTREYAQYGELPIEGGPASSPLVSSGYAPYAAVSPPITGRPAGSPLHVDPVSIDLAQNVQAQDASAGNPFHPGSSPLPTLDEPAPPASAMPGRTPGSAPPDGLTAQIDQGIQQVQQEVAPHFDASLYLRGRTGTDGFEKLLELGAPLEASYSPGGYGRLKVVVTPTYLYSGQSNDAFDQGRFGTNPLGAAGPAAARVQTQGTAGAALAVGYAYDILTADIGASPLGFREQNVVGGIQLSPKLSDTATLQLLVERRVVTDSVLAYAGEKDSHSGETWGGVTRSRGHIQINGSFGLTQYFAGGGGGYLTGDKVARNTEFDAALGATYPVWRNATQELRLGAEIFYFSYDKNLSGFSLGQGGYFSPQQFYAILLPVSWRDQLTPDVRVQLGGSIGYQSYHSSSSDVFPNDAVLQAQLVSLAAATGANTTIAGTRGSGVAGGINGEVDYRIRPNLHIGARAGFDHSGVFSEGTGLIYARYVFDDTI